MAHLFNAPTRHPHSSNYELSLEELEARVMLSTVEIFAAGATGQENLDLFINDQFITTFSNVGGDVEQRDFIKLTSSAGTAAFGPTEFVIFQRVLSSGQLDTSFGTGGSLVVENTEGAPGGISNLIFDSNNSLVVGGVGSSIDPNGGIARFLLS